MLVEFLPDSQNGFRKKRGTRDNILILRAIIDKTLKAGEEMMITYIDFKAAFDSVSHRFLDDALKEAGASDKSRAIFRAIYDSAEAVVRSQSADGQSCYSTSFSVDRGVVQGDIFSPLCFIIAFQQIMKLHDNHAGEGTRLTEDGPPVTDLAYADDDGLLSKTACRRGHSPTYRARTRSVEVSHNGDLQGKDSLSADL